jgi:hypothetical protein
MTPVGAPKWLIPFILYEHCFPVSLILFFIPFLLFCVFHNVRSLHGMSNKRLKPEFPRVLQRMPSSARYAKNAPPVPWMTITPSFIPLFGTAAVGTFLRYITSLETSKGHWDPGLPIDISPRFFLRCKKVEWNSLRIDLVASSQIHMKTGGGTKRYPCFRICAYYCMRPFLPKMLRDLTRS